MPDPETGTRGDRALTGVTLARSVPGGFEKALWWDRFAFFPHPVCNTISIGKTNPDSSCQFVVYNVIAAQSTLPQCMLSSAIEHIVPSVPIPYQFRTNSVQNLCAPAESEGLDCDWDGVSDITA